MTHLTYFVSLALISSVIFTPSAPITYEAPVPLTLEERIDDPKLYAIAKCESNLTHLNEDGSVLRGRQNPKDIGLFQVNEKYWLAEAQKLGIDIYTEDGNIAMAKHIRDTQGYVAWRWSSGCWSKSLPLAQN